jgi:hypothetical protein
VNKLGRTDTAIREALLKTALAPIVQTPEELGALLKADHARYGALIRKLNLKAE